MQRTGGEPTFFVKSRRCQSPTSDRSYRKALPQEAAIAELRAGSGTQFDPRVVEALNAALTR